MDSSAKFDRLPFTMWNQDSILLFQHLNNSNHSRLGLVSIFHESSSICFGGIADVDTAPLIIWQLSRITITYDGYEHKLSELETKQDSTYDQ